MASGAEVRSVPRTARERARAEITREILEAGRRHLATDGAAALTPVIAALPSEVTEVAIQAGLMVWAALLGAVSLELFGQFQNVIGENPGDRDAFFAECVARWAAEIGLG